MKAGLLSGAGIPMISFSRNYGKDDHLDDVYAKLDKAANQPVLKRDMLFGYPWLQPKWPYLIC